MSGEARGIGRSARAAATGPGRERDLVFQSLKAAFAALVAWTGASLVLDSTLALMAPWVAIVLVQSTVYRSLAHAGQQTAAILVGTLLATLVMRTLDDRMAAMAVVLPVTLLLGNWPRLGTQGIYGATAGLFTLASPEVTLAGAGERAGAALAGAAVGVCVNAFVRPPKYLRSTREAVRGVACEAEEILLAIADGVDDTWDGERAHRWYARARRLPSLVRGVRSALEWSQESRRFHPVRAHRDRIGRLETVSAEVLVTLDKVADHVIDLGRLVVQTHEERRDRAVPDSGVTGPYAEMLRQVATALGAYRRMVVEGAGGSGGEAAEARRELTEAVHAAEATYRRLRTELPQRMSDDPETTALFGSWLLIAHRLTTHLRERTLPQEDCEEASAEASTEEAEASTEESEVEGYERGRGSARPRS
ncbi:FUSC family protein [Streptomyces albiaxialis]|uniref:FUSC family protein n=1 Tax=Streptomyces albiaxialis TaxID=329523 RepID=UPI0031DEC948